MGTDSTCPRLGSLRDKQSRVDTCWEARGPGDIRHETRERHLQLGRSGVVWCGVMWCGLWCVQRYMSGSVSIGIHLGPEMTEERGSLNISSNIIHLFPLTRASAGQRRNETGALG